MLELYLSHLKDLGRSYNTYESHRWQLNALFRWVNKDPASVTEQNIQDFLDHRDRKPRTRNQILSIFNTFYLWMRDEGYLDNVPTENIKREEIPEERLWLTPQQRLKFIRAADDVGNKRDKAIVLTMLMAGLRLKELCKLKHQDLILGDKEGVITVRGDFPRQVKIPKQLCYVLGEYLKEYPIGEYLFYSQRGTCITQTTVFNICTKLSKKMKVNVTGETLRQTYGYELARSCVPIHIIAKQMGYTRNSSALKYFEWLDEYQRVRNNERGKKLQQSLD